MASFPGNSSQEANARVLVGVGKALQAPQLALVAMMCLGWGENAMTATGCNSSDHCGLFQLSSSLQAEHDYTDITYWARRAYLDGFYSYGGIIPLSRSEPNVSPGYITNQCQGAYSDLAQGAAYYDQYIGMATQSLLALGDTPPNFSSGGAGQPAAVRNTFPTQGVVDAIEADDWSTFLGWGSQTMHQRAHNGYLWSQIALANAEHLSTFTTTGGK